MIMYAIFNFTDVVILIWLIYIFCIFFNFNIKIETLDESLFILSTALLCNISGYLRRMLEER